MTHWHDTIGGRGRRPMVRFTRRAQDDVAGLAVLGTVIAVWILGSRHAVLPLSFAP